MNDHIAEVQENPCGIVISFHLLEDSARLFHLFADLIRKRLDLRPIGAVCNDKVVCQNRHITDIDHADIFCLLLFQCRDRNTGKL